MSSVPPPQPSSQPSASWAPPGPAHEAPARPYGGAQPAGPAPQQWGPQPGPQGPRGFMAPTWNPVPWKRRALGWIIDYGVQEIFVIIGTIGFTIAYMRWVINMTTTMSSTTTPTFPTSIFVWLAVTYAGWIPAIYFVIIERWIRGGKTGQSLGRRIAKTRLIDATTGQPIGPGKTFLRDLVHYVDSAVLVGYLWPLWDAKRQTLADKIMNTVVVDEADAPLGIHR